MTTTEHLNAILAKCRFLLAIAEKRTPGRWEMGDENNSHYEVCIGDAVASIERQDRYGLHMAFSREEMRANGDFIIASAAGPFEAALRSTIAAIEQLTWLQEMDVSGRISLQDQGAVDTALKDIIAAWPIELL